MAKMVHNGPNGTKQSRLIQMVQSGPKHSRVVQAVQNGTNGPEWSKTVQIGPHGPKRTKMSKTVQNLTAISFKEIFSSSHTRKGGSSQSSNGPTLKFWILKVSAYLIFVNIGTLLHYLCL